MSEILTYILIGIIFASFFLAMLYRTETAYRRKAVKVFDVLSSKRSGDILTGHDIIKRSGLPWEQIEVLWKMENEGYLKGKHCGPDLPIFKRLAMEDRAYEITDLGQSFYEDIKKEAGR